MSNTVQQAHREMVSNLAKPGKKILSEISPNEAHLLHMFVSGGEIGEVVDAHRQVMRARDKYSALQRSPVANSTILTCAQLDHNQAELALLKDCGDLEFYLAGYRIGFNLPDVDGLEEERQGDFSHRHHERSTIELLLDLVVIHGHLIDATKRIIIYRKGYAPKGSDVTAEGAAALAGERQYQIARVSQALDQLTIILGFLYVQFGFTRTQVLQANIDKLTDPAKGRYTDGTYSDTAAVERNDVAPGEDDLSKAPEARVTPVDRIQVELLAIKEEIVVEGPCTGDKGSSDSEQSFSGDPDSNSVDGSSAPESPKASDLILTKAFEDAAAEGEKEADAAFLAEVDKVLKDTPAKPKGTLGFTAKKAAKKAAKVAESN